ncbi:efflux RND transporter periplasmic adaptor subunit [Thiothrix nivea]|uniref:Efflux transporter, RND family, MFP subunit n=1 Tax=Thiothrix nivea (strain ATCC 35100 / DSM 5205 / JP2) TaxID=870187 RepID=A0A656HC68_THINJ|nr:efflux RND transporter periplasmic adaptor subunit [Thiothrix nivea]EIJ33060.1 efflux transporter, RND family, MFP subunit [Thiothrix nivea DSM 5205]
MKNSTALAIRSLFLASVLAALPSLPVRAEEAPDALPAKPALAVSVATPVEESWNTGITANGAIAPWHEAIIASEIGGLRVTDVLVDIGDEVKKGQELVRLAQAAVKADVAQKQASLAEARANAERARLLKSSGALPAQQIDQYLTGEAVAEAALEAQQIRLAQTRILAPDDGVISSRAATLGAVVQTGTELFRLVRQNRVEWQAAVTSQDMGRVQPGQKARLNLPDGGSVEGEVRVVSPTLDANTRNATAYISLPPGNPAKPGMFAEGEILTGSETALTVPQASVILRDGKNYVFALGTDNKVMQRSVKTGRRANGKVEILDGLSTDAKVVATGGAFLNDGDTVEVVDKPPASSLGDKPEGKS